MRAIVGILLSLATVLPPMTAFGQSPSRKSSEEEKTVQVVLYPASEPRPALKYQLLPPFLERRPGNAAVWWNRIPAERSVFFEEFDKEYDQSGKIGMWMNIPLGDPREKAYREKELAKAIHLLKPGGVYSDMERAARFESCDWQFPIRDGNYIAILLPEVQHSREYARLLSAKAHLEIAEGKYDEAVRTLQTGYAEAQHVGQGPTIINSLVGVTIAGIMSYQVQQFIQRPDAPNLYWALSTLPRPLVDFRPGGEAESNILYLQFPDLRGLDKKNLSPDAWRDLLRTIEDDITKLEPILSQPSAPGKLPDAKTPAHAKSIDEVYPPAKRYLIEHGRTAAEVEAMPVAQVVLLYWVKLCDELGDDQFKWFLLPSSEVGSRLERAEQRQKEAFAALPLALSLLPTIAPAKGAETRCEWNLAILRTFEAMRLYAATHDGHWPDNLSDITEVPIPTNPCDGKPFVYRRQGNKAVLTSEKGPKNVPWTYEITLMPKAK